MLLITLLVPAMALADGADAGLNRLFTDPETRARLDAVRKGEPIIDERNVEAAKNVRIDGVVIRREGGNVVWINGESTLNSERIDGMRVRSGQVDTQDYDVPVSVDGKTVRLKPGQVWSGENGKVTDDY